MFHVEHCPSFYFCISMFHVEHCPSFYFCISMFHVEHYSIIYTIPFSFVNICLSRNPSQRCLGNVFHRSSSSSEGTWPSPYFSSRPNRRWYNISSGFDIFPPSMFHVEHGNKKDAYSASSAGASSSFLSNSAIPASVKV